MAADHGVTKQGAGVSVLPRQPQRKENTMKNKPTNYLLPVHLGETVLEIDGTTFLVESRYLGEDSIFRLLGKLMLDDLEPDDYTPDDSDKKSAG